MNAAALVVSIVSLVVAMGSALASLVYTRRSDARNRRREQREEAEQRASQEAQPTGAFLARVDGHPRSYRFQVVNIGRAAATDLVATLIDEAGNVASDLPEWSYLRGTGLLQVDESVEFELPVRADALDSNPLFLHFSWNDSRGAPRIHTSRTEVPRP